jgi:hypothetical protein
MISERQEFSGSYARGDIDFLLQPVDIAPTSIDEKEANIQTGRKHYSEMISEEARPDDRYLGIFQDAWRASRLRIAREVLALAGLIRDDIAAGRLPERISLCSLVRAGAPLGVLLTRALRDAGVDVHHYGVSIVRDRGMDDVAMGHIRKARGVEGILFVDGWTGKGAISRELHRSWHQMTGLFPRLVVLADPCGAADLAGSNEDWLIPTGILGANISGLISRTILNDQIIASQGFHGFVPVNHLADIDFTQVFVDDIHAAMRDPATGIATGVRYDSADGQQDRLRDLSVATIDAIMRDFDVQDINRIKPGIAEATRAVLRRKPHHVIISGRQDPDLQAIIHLCLAADVPLTVDATKTGPYRAITIIRKTS